MWRRILLALALLAPIPISSFLGLIWLPLSPRAEAIGEPPPPATDLLFGTIARVWTASATADAVFAGGTLLATWLCFEVMWRLSSRPGLRTPLTMGLALILNVIVYTASFTAIGLGNPNSARAPLDIGPLIGAYLQAVFVVTVFGSGGLTFMTVATPILAALTEPLIRGQVPSIVPVRPGRIKELGRRLAEVGTFARVDPRVALVTALLGTFTGSVTLAVVALPGSSTESLPARVFAIAHLSAAADLVYVAGSALSAWLVLRLADRTRGHPLGWVRLAAAGLGLTWLVMGSTVLVAAITSSYPPRAALPILAILLGAPVFAWPGVLFAAVMLALIATIAARRSAEDRARA
jgi:hypothetical protein